MVGWAPGIQHCRRLGTQPTYEPGRFVAFEIPSGKMTGVASYLVDPTGANTCRLISNVDFQVAGLARFAVPLLKLIFKRDDEKGLATLKALMEHP